MDLGSLDQAGFLALLKRWQGSGYTAEDETARVGELNAWAKIAAMVSETLDQATRNQFVTSAIEALSEYERVLWMPSDAGFSDAQRQARLKTFMSALPKLVEARLDAAFDAYLGATSGSTVRPSALDSHSNFRAPGAAGIYVQRREPSASQAERSTLDPMLARGLPARALGGLISTGDATFGSGSIDRKSMNMAAAVTPAAQTKAMAAPIEYYPGSVITQKDWVEIQSMLVPKSWGYSLDQTQQGHTLVFCGSVSALSTAVIDNTITWDNRIVQAWGVFSSTDIRPSGSPDLTARPLTDHCWLGASKLGTIATPYVHPLVDANAGAATNASLSIDGAGALTLTNAAGGTRYFVLMVRCSPKHTVGSTTTTQPWLNTSDITNADFTQIARAQEVRDASGDGGATWTQYSLFSGDKGAIRRICYTGPMIRYTPPSYVPTRSVVVLDSSEDWRKRYVLVVPLTKTSGTTYPSVNVDGLGDVASRTGSYSANGAVPRLFYTGNGAAQGSATAVAYQHGCANFSGSSIWVFADSVTGDLIAEMKSTDSVADYACGLFMVIGSEPIDGTGVATQVPLHATQIHPLDLNQIQNNGCYAQGFQGGKPRAYVGSSTPRTAVTAAPLGPIAEGSLPRRPVSYVVRERIGDIDDSTYEFRQKLIGQRRRYVSLTLPAATTTDVDLFNDTVALIRGSSDQFDARDRMIWLDGHVSSTDITIAKSPQVTDVGTERFSAVLYGSYANTTMTIGADVKLIYEFSRRGTNRGIHSRLRLQNESGATTYYINMAIDLSPHVGLTDRRFLGL